MRGLQVSYLLLTDMDEPLKGLGSPYVYIIQAVLAGQA